MPGEVRLRLRPLRVEDLVDHESAGAGGVALFVDRVRLVDPDFELTAESASVVNHIVARLDGLPLAIELAAARCESLGLPQLRQRLDDPLTVLTDGPRTTPPRHRSLRETVNWSYQLLNGQQRRVFRRVATFSAPFTLAAARAVGGAQAESTLLQLVDCSLLAPPTQASDGSARYLMLQVLRAFALEKLAEAGEEADAAAAMCAYYLPPAGRCGQGIETPGGEAAAAGWFDAEDALLHQVLTWALQHDGSSALRLAIAMAGWWRLRGRAVTGYRLVRQASEGRLDHDGDWCAAQLWLGRLAQSTAQWHPALDHFGAVCNALGSGAPSTGLVDALAGRSGTLRNLSRLPEATADARRALDLAVGLDYAEGQAFALTQLSLTAGYAGDVGTSMHWALRAAEVDRDRISDRLARRVALVLTIAQTDAGALDAAQRSCAEGLRSAREAGDVPGQANFLRFTTDIALRAGAFQEAGAHIRESSG